MSKKDFIALADAIRLHNAERHEGEGEFTATQIGVLARFCERQNPNFNRDRWLGYVAGINGPNGGKL